MFYSPTALAILGEKSTGGRKNVAANDKPASAVPATKT